MFFNKNENDQLEIIPYKVGETFPLFNESFEKIKGTDAIFFEATDFNQGLQHFVYYSGLTNNELYNLKKQPVKVRIFESTEGFLLPLFKYGKSNIIQELSFDPTLYRDAKALQIVGKNNIVTSFFIDSNTNILKGIRSANLPLKFIQKAKNSWSKSFIQENFSQKYSLWYSSLQRKYTTKQIWEMAVDVGTLGEVYNLDEIYNEYKE